MVESSSNSTGAVTTAPPAAEERRRLEPWRRFHFGDPAAEVPTLPERTLPVALHGLRGVEVRGGWPLLLDRDPAAESLAQSFDGWLEGRGVAEKSFADNRGRIERRIVRALGDGAPRAAAEVLTEACASALDEIGLGADDQVRFGEAARHLVDALPKGAMLVPFGAAASLHLADAAARRRAERARRRFAAETGGLVSALAALLEADRGRRPEGRPAADQVGKMGNLGARFVDPARLSGVVANRKQGEALPEERRRRLEDARDLLAAVEGHAPSPQWVVAAAAGEAFPFHARVADDPCSAAAALFDEAAAATMTLIRAARLARLEVAGEFDPERYQAALDRLDWRGLGADELALVPPVLAVVRPGALAGAELASLVTLLQSGRPVQLVLLVGGGDEAAAAGVVRFDAAYLGIGLREVYVHQGSPARPESLARGFERALAGSRPALHVVDHPSFASADLDPWLVASARVSGRAAPLLRYEPEAGASWARRMRFDDNPEPAAEWPTEAIAAGLSGRELPEAVFFTYADAALLDPAWSAHFAPFDGASDDLVPLAAWLALPPDGAARALPFVWGVTAEGEARRLVVSRALAFATRDRRGLWRTLEELAGLRNEHVEEAIDRTRREADERATAVREKLAGEHAAELERVRAEADAAAIDRLVSTLFEIEPQFETATFAGPARRAAGPGVGPVEGGAPSAEAPSRAQEALPPGGGEAAAPSAGRPDAGSEAASAAAEQEDAWVDTALCTSCDECIRKYPSIFAYNGDKQAYVVDPRAGSFKDLVRAAEACTAKVIHPGTPWNRSEPDLDDLVARAQAFA